MASGESWEDEMEDTGSSMEEAEKKPEDPTPPEPVQTEPNIDPTPASSIPEPKAETTQEGGQANRGGKKAQRTRRMKLPGSTPQGPVQNSSPSQLNSLPANQKPTKSSNSTATPVLIPPPQIIAFQDGDDEDDEDHEEEPSKILAGLCCVAGGVVNAFLGLWHMVRGMVQAVGRILFTPALLGAVLYCGLVYLIVNFLTDADDALQLVDFNAALKYVMANLVWTVLPVFAAFLAIHFNSNTKHHQFLYESLLDASLLSVNSLIMTSHAKTECIVWLGPVYVVSALFRFLYWVSLFHLSARWQHMFRVPTVLNSVIFTIYNLGVSLQRYAGGFMGYMTASGHSVDVVPTQDAGTQVGGAPDGQDF